MNFLAHLWLADRTRTSLAGAVLGDVVRGSDLSAYPDDIAQGIRIHRRVDALTDRHPLVIAARERFAPRARRYAGIVLDLACDHALATNWSQHSDESLPDFCARAAGDVAGAGQWFSFAGGRAPDADGFARLLASYATAPGIEHAIGRVATRLREPEPLRRAAIGWPDRAQAIAPSLGTLLRDLHAVIGEVPQPVQERPL